MASTSVKVKSLGFCLTDIVKGSKYALTSLNVLPTLCCDIIFGLIFKVSTNESSLNLVVIFKIVVSHDNLRGCCS